MASSNVLIRNAVTTDVPAIRACAHQAYSTYIDSMGQRPAPMIADFDTQVSKGVVSVATKKDELVGFVVYYPVKADMHLENVAVLPSCQGLGIGKQLIQYVQDKAVALGMHSIQLYTNEMMHENIAMYPKLGYSEIERKTQSGFNRVFFCKTL